MSWRECPDPRCEQAGGAVEMIVTPEVKDLGGFQVRRVLPSPGRRMVGPFIFFDHFGPAAFGPGEGIDVRPHPHIGIETVTYLFEGEIFHRDSLGNARAIRPGAVNWMTAGRGIAHSERASPEERARESSLHGIQCWVALPDGKEEVPPDFRHFPAEALPEIDRRGSRVRLIAGSAYGESSPVAHRDDLLYADASLVSGSELDLPDECRELGLYVAQGAVEIDGTDRKAGRMVIVRTASRARIRAREDSRVMIIGGDRPKQPRYLWWNLVSSSRERIEQAKRDWTAGRFDPVPGDSEFIPLPED